MCGIVGFTHPDEVDRAVIDAMTECLKRRGPDAHGVHVESPDVHLGHRLLSVQDLTGRAGQPMGNEEGTIHIVYNGECYNHRELRRLLPDVRWRSTGDTETLLRLYEKFGEQFIDKVNGMFALAIHDKRSRKLLLYRDRLGEKPLYYAKAGAAFLFASDPAAFLKHPKFSREIDPAGVAQFFTYNYLGDSRSIYRNVKRLPAAHYLVHDLARDELKIHRYWSPENVAAERRHASDVEYCEEFRELFFDAVRMRTLSDVPLGCFLSGGIDSSSIAYALTKAGAGEVRTFNIGFAEKQYDESGYAEQVAGILGTTHESFRAQPKDCLPLIGELPEVCGEPFADPSILPMMLLSRMTRQKVTVALSGDGGDELFLGYDRYELAQRVQRTFRSVPGGVRRIGAAVATIIPNYRLRMVAQGLQYHDDEDLYASVFIGWNAPFAHKLLTPEVRSAYRLRRDRFHRTLHRNRRLPLVEQAGIADLQHYLPDDVLTKVDRATMHYSLEGRAPMLDHRLVHFAQALPPHLRMGGGSQKVILRKLLGEVLPRPLLERPKAGFAVPLRHWLRGELKSMMRDLLSPSSLRTHGFLNEDFVQRLIRDHLSSRWNFERQLWALMVFQIWHNAQEQ
ncbi:asparagine synthase (glutamine-hydrolyzing) [Candidatus Sumerlaeota bacterium]|nr:asparagine synthase (glutamine-hydrolyzing) [Candidatus Sumerlaeota bacterium]